MALEFRITVVSVIVLITFILTIVSVTVTLIPVYLKFTNFFSVEGEMFWTKPAVPPPPHSQYRILIRQAALLDVFQILFFFTLVYSGIYCSTLIPPHPHPTK